MQNAFRTCRILTDENALDYDKLTETVTTDNVKIVTNQNLAKVEFSSKYFKCIESFIEKDKIATFNTSLISGHEWSGPVQDKSLYNYWKVKTTCRRNRKRK